MNKSLRLRLTSQDKLILEWWSLLSRKEINISKAVSCAISYYAQSGRYLYLGKVFIHPSPTDVIVKKLYLQDTSTAYKWLEERMAEGEKYSAAIRRILRNSIKFATKEDEVEIVPLDFLIEQVENIGKNLTPVSSLQNQEIIEQHTAVRGHEMFIRNISEPDPSVISTSMEEEDAAADLMDTLLGGNGLSL